MAKDNTGMWLLGIVVVGFIVYSGGYLDKDTTDTTPKIIASTCDSTTTPDLDINTFDIDNPGTALTETTNMYRKTGNKAWTNFTAGTAITNLEFGETYEIVLGIGTLDFLDNAYGEYFVTDPIDCKESTVLDMGMHNDAIETEITATFYNKNHDASSEIFSAGQVKNVYAHFEAGSDQILGNMFIAESGLADNGNHRTKYPNVYCFNLNSSAWDAPDKVTFDGEEMNKLGTPQRHTSASAHATYCYEAPVINDFGQELVIRMDADDTNTPSANSSAAGGDPTSSLYAGNFFVDDDGELAWGIETDEGNAVGTDAADTLSLDFTNVA